MTSESITIQAFGPYIKKNTINFKRLNEDGLFVISGNTGSGKTTILDAISVALYGKSASGERSFKELRNTNAPDEVPTIVEYIFSLGEKKYKFLRKLFISFRKRKKEFELKSEHKCFSLKDNMWISIDASSESSVRIIAEKLLGLDCNQFSKVVMLPQGEFKNLLLSSSTDKAKILAKLFAAARWEKITEKIKFMSDEKSSDIKAKITLKERILKEYGVSSIEEFELKYKENFSSLQKEKFLQKKTLDKIKDISNKIDKLKEFNSISKSKLMVEEKLCKLEKEFNSSRDSLNEISNYSIEKECLKNLKQNLILEIAKLEKSYRDIENLCKIKEKKSQLFKGLIKLKNKTESLKRNLLIISEKSKNLNSEIFKIEENLASMPELLCLNEKLKLDYEKYLEILQIQNELDVLHINFDNKKSTLKLEEDNLNYLKEELKSLEKKIIFNNCLSLSNELIPGKPCPICGSLYHPSPALQKYSTDNVRLNEQLISIKDDIEKSEKENSYQNELLIKLSSKIELKTEELDKKKEVLINEYGDFQNLNLQMKNTQKSLYDANISEKKLFKLKDDLMRLEQEQKPLSETLKNLLNEINQSEFNIKFLSEQEDLLCNSLSLKITDKDKIKCIIDSKKEETISTEKRILTLENKLSESKSAFTFAKANYENSKEEYYKISEDLKKLLENTPKITTFTLNDLNDTLSILQVENENSLQKIGRLSQVYELMNKNAKYLNEINFTISESESEYSKIEKLYQLLSGSNIMKIPIKMFVLGMALDDILSRANIYLSNLSHRRYSLSRKSENTSGRAYAGLDIEVFDAYLGAIRPASTLSGGELFLASLALALGLSDVIQSHSGGIRIDSLFIDEGFGSLDYDTLNTVIKSLNDIKKNGRIIGVISHVDEVKNRINAKIEIKNNKYESNLYVKIG